MGKETSNNATLHDRRDFYGKLIHLALPIALQNFLLAAVSASDTLMLVRLNQTAMTAVSLASMVQFVQNMLMMVIVGAGTILGSQYYGKNDMGAVKALKNIMLRRGIACGIVFFLLCALLPKPIMDIFTDNDELIETGSWYLRFASFSYLLTAISQVYLTMMKIIKRAATSTRISAVAVVVNIGLNWVLIFGLGPIPSLGVVGAAIATGISRVIELILALVASRRSGVFSKNIQVLREHNHILAHDFMKVSLPLLGGIFVWGVGFTIYSVITGHMGPDVAAASSAASMIRNLMLCTCTGPSAAAGILVGNALGSGDLARGRQYGDWLLRIALIIGIINFVIVLALMPLAPRLIQLSDAANGYLTSMLIIIAVYMIARAATDIIINGIFAAGGDTMFNMYSLAVCMWGIAIPLSYLGAFVFHWPVWVVYACTCLDEVGKIPWVLAHYKKYKWVRNLTRQDVCDENTTDIADFTRKLAEDVMNGV